MPEKISIMKDSGETLSSQIVSVFLIPDTEKKYIITTENAVDPHGLTVLHVSEIVDDSLQKIGTDDEWSSIKTIMRAMISGNAGTYQFLPPFESTKASSQYSRDISVSASAAKQMMDNYMNGEKNAVGGATVAPADPMAGMMNQPVNGMQAPAVTPSSIFPTSGTVPNEDYELVPGIAEMPVDGMTNPNAMDMNPPALDNTAMSMNMMPGNDMIAPQDSMSATGEIPQVGMDATQVMAQPIPQAMPGAVNPMDNLVGNQQNLVAQAMPGMMPQAEMVPPVLPTEPVSPVVPMTPMPPVVNDVQVAQPTQVVPTAQIAQEAQGGMIDEVKLNPNAEPSFAPDASLDEVVAGSRDLFIDGVTNLVKTIQEKVYRDLYNKEAELKQKETELAQKELFLEQKEKMLNEQMMAMMSNFTAMQAVAQPAPVAPVPAMTQQPAQPALMAQPVMQPMMQPTVVQASNDVIAA